MPAMLSLPADYAARARRHLFSSDTTTSLLAGSHQIQHSTAGTQLRKEFFTRETKVLPLNE